MWEGVSPLPHQGVFAFLGFKLSDLVHTFGEFVAILSIQKRTRSRSLPQMGVGRRESEATEQGEGVGGGNPPLPHQGFFFFAF